MSANQSYLSNPKYNYDFVVATTEASINAGLKEYLATISQPETVWCFLADQNGNPSESINLADLKARVGGIDPFDIPDGTPTNDPRIRALTEIRFMVAIKLKLGLPPGIMPKNLPSIVELGSSANNVTFRLLCSEFKVIQNTPAGGFSSAGTWNLWSQPAGTAWYFATTVNLVYKDLDKLLNTPYFNSHPDAKQALLNKLENLESGAFSLQQLLFDLDNAAMQSIPQIEGLDPTSNAGTMLTRSFVNGYFATLRAQGEPVLSVNAVANTADGSTLRLTGMERQVGQFLDDSGVVVTTPTPDQKAVSTLNYLCAANNNPLPGAASFSWNWVEPADLSSQSGVIAINRNTMAKFYQNVLMPLVKKSCIGVSVYVTCDHTWAPVTGKVDYNWTFTTNKTPQTVVIPPTGDTVLTISFSDYADDDTRAGATYGQLKLWSNYDCNVQFKGNQITIIQHLKINSYVKWDLSDVSCDVFDKTITDVYTLSVSQNGALVISEPVSTPDDKSESPNASWLTNLFTSINDITADIKSHASNFLSTKITDIPGLGLQSFVFPGARVFTYKDVEFSDNQDLVTQITYAKPS